MERTPASSASRRLRMTVAAIPAMVTPATDDIAVYPRLAWNAPSCQASE